MKTTLILVRSKHPLTSLLFVIVIISMSSCLSSYPLNGAKNAKLIDPRVVLYSGFKESTWRVGGVIRFEEDTDMYQLQWGQIDQIAINKKYLIISQKGKNAVSCYNIYSYEYLYDVPWSKWVFKLECDSTELATIPDSLGLPVNDLRSLSDWLNQ